MLQDSSSKSSLRVKQRFGASWADDMRRPVEGANSSALRLQDPANVSTTLDEGQGGTGDSALEGVDSAVSGPDTLPNIISCDEETDDVEMDVLRDIIEEQRMMMSPDCLNQVELADINSKLSSFSIKSSNFEISPMKNMDHDFRNGVRIVNKISMEQEHDSSRNEETDAPFNLLTEFKAPVMSTALSILQISIRRRQDRFQAAGVCEALVEVRHAK